MDNEIWKPITGYEGLYDVSSHGRIKALERKIINKNGNLKSYHEKILTWHKSKCDKRHQIPRYHVELWKDNKRVAIKVHKLVATAFIKNPDGKPQINHFDGNPANNHFSNLEWVTSSENNKHAWDNGLRTARNEKPIKGTNLITGNVVHFKSVADAARYFNVTEGSIKAPLKGYGRSKNGCGYRWEYQ